MDKNATLYDLARDEILPSVSTSVLELPPADTKRWVARRKAVVVGAVRSGAITLEEACRRYELSVEEFLAWQRAIESHGVAGLRVTRLQIYRDTPRLVNPAAEFPSRCPRRCGKRAEAGAGRRARISRRLASRAEPSSEPRE